MHLGDMQTFLTGLTATEGGVTSANLWAQITPAAGTLALVVIFAFGYRVARKIVKGVSKGKANFQLVGLSAEPRNRISTQAKCNCFGKTLYGKCNNRTYFRYLVGCRNCSYGAYSSDYCYYPDYYFNKQVAKMISIQGLPETGCNVFYGNYVDNYLSNVRTRYYIYDGQAIASSTSTYATPPANVNCISSSDLLYDPLLQTQIIMGIVVIVIAVMLFAYKVVIEPFIKMKKG